MPEGEKPSTWDAVAAASNPNWYLDPLVAAQKREEHLRLVRTMAELNPHPRRVLKTDLFEEAFGDDQLLGDFPAAPRLLSGIDVAPLIAAKCQQRFTTLHGNLAAADLRRLPFRDGSFDWIVSNSSLDHFASHQELESALKELCRVLAPGGLLLLTFDNPGNPLYHALRFAARRGWSPFPLGQTLNPTATHRLLTQHGLVSQTQQYFLFNPRGLSTILFLLARKTLGRYADPCIAALLRCFALLEKCPGKKWSACFHATLCRKPD
jgi:SAM-dependent methyltransferase